VNASALSSTGAKNGSAGSRFHPLLLTITAILPSGVYVRVPVGLGPNELSARSPLAVEAEAETSFHVPARLSIVCAAISYRGVIISRLLILTPASCLRTLMASSIARDCVSFLSVPIVGSSVRFLV
jgi:hypothetical protein